MQNRATRLALRVSIFYALFASTWIIFSDQLLEAIAPDTQTYAALSTFKGWAFVFVTGVLLFLVVRQLLRQNEREISERRLAQERLADLAKFPDENPNPVLRVQADGTILYANRAGHSLLQMWDARADGLAPEESRQWIQHALATGQPEKADATWNGRRFHFLIAPTHANGYANLYGDDVTERTRAEQLLREREEQYRKVVDISTNAIFIMQDGKFALLNPSALKLFGADRPEQLVGKPVFDFVHTDYRDIIHQRVRQAEQQDQPLPLLEQKLVKLDGS
ncbi:MAG TPA: PAS domain-containing protein, partial [Verrucomicrobiae bacterium]|nr:PAS domain-containing protein [Verrucomicrobiae bacterium]